MDYNDRKNKKRQIISLRSKIALKKEKEESYKVIKNRKIAKIETQQGQNDSKDRKSMKKSKDKNIARIQRQLGYKDSKN